jgi:hypothetical protein
MRSSLGLKSYERPTQRNLRMAYVPIADLVAIRMRIAG